MTKFTDLHTKLEKCFPESLIEINGLSNLPEHYAPTGRNGTHLDIRVVSGLFKDKPLLEQHKMIHSAIENFMQMNGGFIHAVTIKTSVLKEDTKV